MKDFIASIGTLGCVVLAVIALIAFGWGADLLYLKLVEGPSINIHTQNIRHSIGYVDAQNSKSRDRIAEYSGTPASDTAHRCALLLDIRATEGQLSTSEISDDVAQFMAAHSTDCNG